MTHNINAEIISIGTEILLGEITDTNSVHIARVLRDIGVNVYYMASVGDNEQRIADTVRLAMSRADIVITCGGLGPTVDDVTRQGVAAATDRGLTFHQELLDAIVERFASFRFQMSANNRRQAYLPDDAIPVRNPVGTAPCYIVEHNGAMVASLPGVPREMKFLMGSDIIPFIKQKFGLKDEVIKARILKTGGIGESTLDEMLGAELLEASNPTIGLAAHSGQIDIRVTAKAASVSEAMPMLDEAEAKIREKAGKYIFGVDEQTLEGALVALLQANEATLAVSETGVSGIVTRRLGNVTGGEAVLRGAEQHDEPVYLQRGLGTDETQLKELSIEAANAVRDQHDATVGIAIVSQPDVDENPDIEVGTAVTVCTAANVRSRVYGFGGRSDSLEEFAGNWSLSIAWSLARELVDDAELR